MGGYVLHLVDHGYLQDWHYSSRQPWFCDRVVEACFFSSKEEAVKVLAFLDPGLVLGTWHVYYMVEAAECN